MWNISKHWDLLVLAGAVILVVGGVIAFDRSGLSAKSDAEDVLNGKDSLYHPTERPIAAQIADAPQESPAWLDDEDNGPRERSRPVPAPYQKGVVQLGPGASLGGQLPFPEDDPWNQRIDHLEVDPLSDVIIAKIGCEKNLYGDFGSGSWNGAPIGIPYVVVDGQQERFHIKYTAYGDESDPGPYPIPRDAPIEGDPNIDGDRHVIVVDRDNWKLYELFRAFPIADGQLWRAESGAIFDLTGKQKRPVGWTSADAAGLPIFPGLVRYEEAVEQGEIRHALRFTVSNTRNAYVPPASHWASRQSDISLPPMGMRVRLRANFDITPYPPEVQVILTALKRYGMILADNGSDWFISGSPDPRWNDDNLRKLKELQGCDFEVVLMENIVEEEPCDCPEEKEALRRKFSKGAAKELVPTLSRDSFLK
ncbi:hypothetical protein SH661x_003919 [Planctomicrobium sp. SH661]|uniref:hypothetical protein n=1 Tax=Planctomicrobium sp. SH661 TaxID=3448124 RepID=UPI003F5BCCBE